jgi:hypothetical protein
MKDRQMKLTDILPEVGRPVAYFPRLRRMAGSVNAALLLCQLIYWTGKEASRDGWIYKTAEEIERETGLTRWEQQTARKLLVDRGLLTERYERRHNRMYFRVCQEQLKTARAARDDHGGDVSIGNEASPQSKRRDFHIDRGDNSIGNEQSPPCIKGITETTTENTSQNTTESAGAGARAHAPSPGGSASSDHPHLLLFHDVTGAHPARSTRQVVLEAIGQVHARLGRPPTAGDLGKFFTEWCSRGFNPRNLAWLTEWAASGIIPGQQGHAHRTKQAERDEFERGLQAWESGESAQPGNTIDAEVIE